MGRWNWEKWGKWAGHALLLLALLALAIVAVGRPLYFWLVLSPDYILAERAPRQERWAADYYRENAGLLAELAAEAEALPAGATYSYQFQKGASDVSDLPQGLAETLTALDRQTRKEHQVILSPGQAEVSLAVRGGLLDVMFNISLLYGYDAEAVRQEAWMRVTELDGGWLLAAWAHSPHHIPP